MTNMESQTVRIMPHRVERIMDAIFARLGVEGDERQVVVDRLMEASLSGYHSHGVMRISMYTEGIRAGNMVPGAPIDILGETVCTQHLDANKGLGPWTATEAMKRAVYARPRQRASAARASSTPMTWPGSAATWSNRRVTVTSPCS